MPDSPSPFLNVTFNSATFTFKVATDDYVIDELGNRRSAGAELTLGFYLRGAGGSTKGRLEGGSTSSASYTVNLLTVNGVPAKRIPLAIKQGAVGHGKIDGRECSVKIESLTQSSIAPVREVLGDRATISVEYKNREGVA